MVGKMVYDMGSLSSSISTSPSSFVTLHLSLSIPTSPSSSLSSSSPPLNILLHHYYSIILSPSLHVTFSSLTFSLSVPDPRPSIYFLSHFPFPSFISLLSSPSSSTIFFPSSSQSIPESLLLLPPSLDLFLFISVYSIRHLTYIFVFNSPSPSPSHFPLPLSHPGSLPRHTSHGCCSQTIPQYKCMRRRVE